MSIAVKRAFRNLTGAAALSALVAGCASGVPGKLNKDTCMNDGAFSPTVCKIETQTTIRINSAKDGPSTKEITEQQIVVGGSPLKQTGEFIWNAGGTAANVLSGVGALEAGKGAKAFGEGVKDGKLKPGDYIHNETTTLGQTQSPSLTATQNPNISNDSASNSTANSNSNASASATATQSQGQQQGQAQTQQTPKGPGGGGPR